jgi:hypothetical protein
MGPALSLGYEALAERFDVECHAQVEVGMLTRANRVLPEGLQFTLCEPLPEGAPSLGKAVSACSYRLRRTPELSGWPASPAGLAELAAGVLEWRLDCDELRVTLNARQADGPTPSVKALLAVLGIPEGTRPLVPVLREGLILASMSAAVV